MRNKWPSGLPLYKDMRTMRTCMQTKGYQVGFMYIDVSTHAPKGYGVRIYFCTKACITCIRAGVRICLCMKT